jgi:hypothetical protein
MESQGPTGQDATDIGIEKLEDSYRRKIDFALRRSGIRGKARERLIQWRAEGLREISQKPESLPWLNEKVWKSLNRSLRVAMVFAVCATDKYPGAVRELHKEIRRLMEPFRGRRSESWISSILSDVAELRGKGLSWLQIAQRHCPDRGPAHRCDRRCVDRIRVAYQREAKNN